MICSKCNAEIPAESKFCPICGSAVQQQSENNNKFCTNCGTALAAGVLFCTECGTAVTQPVAVKEAEPAQPAAPVTVNDTPAPNPVMSAEPTVSAIPMPVNDVTAVSAVPTPVNDVQTQPVSAIPMPVNDVPGVSAVPTPVNDVGVNSAAQQAAFVAAAATMTAPANEQAAAPAGGVNLSKGGESAAVADFTGMPAASAAAAPAKKKSKIGLWIGVSAAAVVVAAAAVVGFCFRGVATNLVVGNNKYASMIEGDSIKAVSAEMKKAAAEETFTEYTGDVMGAALTMMNTMSDAGFETEGTDISTINLEQIISTYYNTMMQYAGVNYVEYTFGADIQLTEAGKSALGVDGEADFDELLSHINDGNLKLSCTFAEDSLDVYVAMTDGNGFTLDAKGIVCSDGTVGVMFPFGSDKCIAIKLDANGEVLQVEEVDFKVDQNEVDRLTQEITAIYLAYIEKADVDVKGGSEVTAGDITETGRLITADMSAELIEKMLGEMLTHIANDAYFMDLAADYSAEIGLDYDADYYKNSLMDAAEELEDTVAIGLRIETLVDNNGNILAKSYIAKDESASEEQDVYEEENDIADMMALYEEYSFEYGVEEGEVDEIKVTFIAKDDVSVFAVFADNAEMMYAKVQAENETDGSVRLVLNDDGMTVSLNIDYEGVQYAKFLETEMLVGKYTIYTAGTEESLPEGSSYKLIIDNSVSGNEYSSSISVEVAPYGKFGISAKMTGDNVTAEGIPSDAYIITDPEGMSDDAAMELAEYIKGMLTDIQTALQQNSTSPVAGLIGDAVGEGVEYFEDILDPKADYEDISELSDEMYKLCDTLANTYDEYYMLISDDMFDEIQSVYSDISDLSDELYYADEIDMATFEEYKNTFYGYKETANEILDEITKLVEDAQENGVSERDIVGMYDIDTVLLYGNEYAGTDLYEYYTILFTNNGTYSMDCEGEVEIGTWTIMGNMVILEDEYGTLTFTVEGDTLTYSDTATDFTMIFKKR